MTLRLKERELVAVGASVAAGCKPCTDYHMGAVRKAKATEDEIRKAIDDAMSVRRNALEVMTAYGLHHLGETGEAPKECCGETDRIKELVSVAAAFAVNCTTNLENHLAAATALGVTGDEIADVIKLAGAIRGKAASHVEKLAEAEPAPPSEAATASGCGCSAGH